MLHVVIGVITVRCWSCSRAETESNAWTKHCCTFVLLSFVCRQQQSTFWR